MKKLFTLLLLIYSVSLIAQNKESISTKINSNAKALINYEFEETTSTFTSISETGTLLTPNDWDDGYTDITDIGFDFNYNGIVYTQFSVNTNGTVNLGAQQIDEETNDLESPDYFNLFAPLWDDLQFPDGGTGGGIFMQLDGNSGTQILTIEHHQVSRYNSTGNVNFQVRLYEEDNHIEFVYDDLANAASWNEYSTTSIGINAQENDVTVFLSVTPDPVNGATVSGNTPNNNILREDLAQITSGTTYSFTPPEISPDTDIALTEVLSPQDGLLSGDESIWVSLTNVGQPINVGLVLNYELFDIDSGIVISSSEENFEAYGSYPINSLQTVDFMFSETADLSANHSYELMVKATIEGDVDTTNNSLIVEINGIILGDTLYNNGPIITHSGAGYEGADVSAVQQDLGLQDFGYNTSNLIGYRNADQFTIPENEEWTIAGFAFYNYQTESDTISTIEYSDFKIWSGTPDTGLLLHDFTLENMLSASFWTGIYRTPSSTLDDNQRPIMYNVCNFDEDEEVVLETGTYWIDWSSDGSLLSGPWQPFISILGNATTGDGLHFGTNGWENMVDEGTSAQQGMPFIVYGSSENTSGYSDIQNQDYRIYPNPIKDYFIIENLDEKATIEMINSKGQTIKSIDRDNGNSKIMVSDLKSGIYMLKISVQSTFVLHKVIVQ